MATRQYIGARYVPKFYQNSVDGSTTWQSNVVYEPLTYVTLTNGHMYISKKQVPATVGTPASNIDYWLDVGSYNGFIDSLQSQINVIEGEIDDLEAATTGVAYEMSERTFLFLADSYDVLTNYVDSLGNRLHCKRYVKKSQSGASFVRHDSPWDQYTYYNVLTTLNPLNDTDKAEITDVCILASVNDNPTNDADLTAAMSQLNTYLRNNLPKLRHVYLLSVGWADANYSMQSRIDLNIRRYSTYSPTYGWSFIDCTRVMRMGRWFNPEDGYHPLAAGGTEIAVACANAILTGSCQWTARFSDYYYDVTLPTEWDAEITRPSTGSLRLIVKCDTNGVISWGFFDADMFFTSIGALSLGAYTITLTPQSTHKNIFPEYYKAALTPIRNSQEGVWDSLILQQINGATSINAIGGGNSGTTNLRVLCDSKFIIDPS